MSVNRPRLSAPAHFALVLAILATVSCGLLGEPDKQSQATSQATSTAVPPEQITQLEDGKVLASSYVVVSPDGRLVAAVNPDSDSITFLDAETAEGEQEIKVGRDPRTLAFSEDSKLLVVANYGSDSLSIIEVSTGIIIDSVQVGAWPYGVLVSEGRIYVAESAIGRIAILELSSGDVLDYVYLDDYPMGLAINTVSKELYVTHLFLSELSVIELETGSVRQIHLGENLSLSQSLILSTDGQTAYLPHFTANTDNQQLTFDTTVFPVISVVDLVSGQVLPRSQIALDTSDKPVNMPFAAAISPDNQTLFVVNAGSNDLSIINLETNLALAHLELGANPRGVAITPNGSKLYVNNVLDGTLSLVDTGSFTIRRVIPITEIPLPEDLLLGKRIFNSAQAPILANDNWISCATCHFDGGMDARTWLGFPDGPRNTTALFGVADTLPIHWSGDLDELQDVEVTIREIQFGEGLIEGHIYDTLGLPHEGLSEELDALALFMASLEVPPSPNRGNFSSVNTGHELFLSLGCNQCHPPPFYTDLSLHDVGTGNSDVEKNSHGRGTSFDTPTLLGIWQTAPYFHDGSAPTLNQVLGSVGVHKVTDLLNEQQIEDLIAFLNALPERGDR